jgi:hypothetical protein
MSRSLSIADGHDPREVRPILCGTDARQPPTTIGSHSLPAAPTPSSDVHSVQPFDHRFTDIVQPLNAYSL